MIIYLLKSATCLALLLAFYHFVLEKEKMHNFNRFYLLGSVFFSFLVPLCIIYIDAAPIIIENVTAGNITYDTEEIPSEIIVENTMDYKSILMTLYFIISSILFIRLGRNLFNIINKTRKNTVIPFQKAILILVDDKIQPHTFWNYIFINKEDYRYQKIEQELFTHELTHVTQKHTLDILIIEIIQIVFWINPFFILLKKAMKLNHEFLADDTVIIQHKNTFQYQHLLLNKAAWKNDYYLASNLNYSLTKKRLKMMTTQSSQTQILLKKLAVIPLLAGFVFLFAERVESQEIIEIKQYIDAPVNVLQNDDLETDDIRLKLKDINSLEIIYLDKDTVIQNNKASEKQMKEYKLLLNDAKENNVYKLKDIKKMQFIYSLMSNTQKKSVQNISEIISPPPPPIKIDIDSNQYNLQKLKPEIINQKDSTKFHKNWYITINGEKYYYTFDKNERIARYYKNGKLANLDIVKEYKKKHKIFEDLKATGKHYVFKPENEQKEIDKEFSDLGGMYFRMPRVDKNKVPYPDNPIKPYVRLRKGDKIWYKKLDELTEEEKLLLPPPPPMPNASEKEILKAKKAYSDWKKRTGNDLPVPSRPAKNK